MLQAYQHKHLPSRLVKPHRIKKLKTLSDIRNFPTTPRKFLMSLRGLSLKNMTLSNGTQQSYLIFSTKLQNLQTQNGICCPTSTAKKEFTQKILCTCAFESLDATSHKIYLQHISLLISFLLSFTNFFCLPTRIADAYKKQTKHKKSNH